MWDGFPLAGPSSVFFAGFGGAAHSVAITTSPLNVAGPPRGNSLFAVCRTE